MQNTDTLTWFQLITINLLSKIMHMREPRVLIEKWEKMENKKWIAKL